MTPPELRAPSTGPGPRPELSLVAPVCNEVDNLPALYRQVRAVFANTCSFELLLVDDGSRDGSDVVIRRLARSDARVRGIFFACNCGQTSAMAAGIHAARAPVIATLDADLQNAPADLPGMLARLAGHDAVVGYRAHRRDNFVRRASSRIANAVRNRICGDSIRDTGCSLKVFRAEAIQALPLFEGMHRFLPTLLRMHGFEVIEHAVSHRPRTAGQSKYGVWNRLFRSLRDLIAVRWMKSRTLLLPIVHMTEVRQAERPRRTDTLAKPAPAANAERPADSVVGGPFER